MLGKSFGQQTFIWCGGRGLGPPCPDIQKCTMSGSQNKSPNFPGLMCNSTTGAEELTRQKCKSCRTHDKYAMYICWCMDPGRNRMFQILVTKLRTWITVLYLQIGMYLLAGSDH
jgi:hypothetical protein